MTEIICNIHRQGRTEIAQRAFSYTVKTADAWLPLRSAVGGAAGNGLCGAMGLWLGGSLASCSSLPALDCRGDSGDDLSREPWGDKKWRVTPSLEAGEK